MVEVPGDDTKYIIDVFAEDEAGNISYVAKYIYLWDGSQFKAIFMPYEWQTEIIANYSSEILPKEYVSDVIENSETKVVCIYDKADII